MGSYILSMIIANPVEAFSLSLLAAELITRLTPTKTDDCFVERIGHLFRGIMDFVRVPNFKREL